MKDLLKGTLFIAVAGVLGWFLGDQAGKATYPSHRNKETPVPLPSAFARNWTLRLHKLWANAPWMVAYLLGPAYVAALAGQHLRCKTALEPVCASASLEAVVLRDREKASPRRLCGYLWVGAAYRVRGGVPSFPPPGWRMLPQQELGTCTNTARLAVCQDPRIPPDAFVLFRRHDGAPRLLYKFKPEPCDCDIPTPHHHAYAMEPEL